MDVRLAPIATPKTVYHILLPSASPILPSRHARTSVDAGYVDGCRSTIWTTPSRTRFKIDWSKSILETVRQTIKDIPHLCNYTRPDHCVMLPNRIAHYGGNVY